MIKADGDFLMFFSRPIACALGLFTLFVWLSPLLVKLYTRAKPAERISYE
jgi:TctA family transporter